MERQEFFKVSRKQQVVDEVGKWFSLRHVRLQRLILDDNLFPEERAKLTLVETELSALENIISDELYALDEKLETTQKEIQEAKLAEKFR